MRETGAGGEEGVLILVDAALCVTCWPTSATYFTSITKKKKKKIFFILSSSHSVATSGQLLVSKSGFSLQIKSVDSLVDVNMRSAIAELFFLPLCFCVCVCVCV